MIRPERLQDEDGKIMEDAGDFTELVVGTLASFVKNIEYSNRVSMITIPEVMAKDENKYSKSLRIWMEQTRSGDTSVVKRIKLDPNAIRDTGKLVFVTVQIQGEQDPTEEGAVVEDEEEKDEESATKEAGAPEGEGSGDQTPTNQDEGFGDDEDMSPFQERADDDQDVFVEQNRGVV